MTPEEKSLLMHTHELSVENNKILRGIRRSNRFSVIFRIIYWAVIIGLTVGAFYFIQPYLTFLNGLTGAGGFNSDSAKNAASQFQDLLK